MRRSRRPFFRAYLASLRRELRGSLFWLLLLFLLASLLLYGFSRQLLAETDFSAGEGEKNFRVPESFRYSVSLVTEGNPLITGIVRSQLEEFPLIRKVYLESEEEAAARLASGETLLSIRIPAELLREISSGASQEEVNIRLSSQMPEEAKRLATVFRSLGRALSTLHASAFAWQDLYVELSGDETGSWNKMTRFAFQEIEQIRDRSGLIRLRSVSPYLGLGHFLAAVTLLLAILPSILLFERRGASLESSFREKIHAAGAGSAVTLAELSAYFLMSLLLLLPVALLLLRLFGMQLLLRLLPLALSAALTALLLAASLCSLGFPPALRASVAWLFLLLLFFSAGAMYPTELMPTFLQKSFSFSPLRPVFRSLLALFARVRLRPAFSAYLWGAAWLFPSALLLLLTERRRRQL